MKTIRPLYFFLFMCGLFLLTGCIIKDSPAPGCVEYLLFAPIGGCNGKTIITDLELEGFPDCAQVTVNNCNGGVLEVQNDCSIILTLENIALQSGETMTFDIQPTMDGSFELIRIPSNFSDFTPAEDQIIEIAGSIGDQVISLSLTKTAPLCE